MIPHMNGKISDFLNGQYHYDKHKKLYSSHFFENPNIFGSISKYCWTAIRRIEIQTQLERTVQSGSSPEKFPDLFLQCIKVLRTIGNVTALKLSGHVFES